MTLKELTIEYGMDAKLLKAYFQAFANLYGICPLRRALRIINRQNPKEKFTEEQLLAFADHYKGSWKIVSPDEFYSNVSVPTPMYREIVNKELMYYGDYEGYDCVRHMQGSKEYYIPPKEELLRYSDFEYYEKTDASAAMESFLRDQLKVSDWQRLMLEIVINLRFDTFDLQILVDRIGDRCSSFSQIEKLSNLYSDLNNNSRMMVNRGLTPNELNRRSNPRGALPSAISFGPGMQELIRSGQLNADEMIQSFSEMDIPQTLKQSLICETQKAKKPGRNDPCPCGSGKKYKKCCGR